LRIFEVQTQRNLKLKILKKEKKTSNFIDFLRHQDDLSLIKFELPDTFYFDKIL